MAPTYDAYHSSYTVESLTALIEDKLAKEFPVGAATVANNEKNLV